MHKFKAGDIVELEDGIGLILGIDPEYNSPMLNWIVMPTISRHVYRGAHPEYDWCVGGIWLERLKLLTSVDWGQTQSEPAETDTSHPERSGSSPETVSAAPSRS